ncbi:MAG: thioredoxin domain-containing protein [Burkholderiaceae bacterium]
MRLTTPSSRGAWRRLVWPASAAALVLLLLLAWFLSGPPAPNAPLPAADDAPAATPAQQAGPPWHHGAADARFTLILYADLECPYCKAYVPQVMAWVDQHPDTRLRWHHLPLPAHEPAATQLASLAECAGEAGGTAAFWQAVAWLYQHTRGDGQGLPEQARFPGQTAVLQACLNSDRTQARIQTQAREASRDGIAATPTLRVRDEATGQSLLLPGPVEADALLSALDLLTSNELPAASAEPSDLSAIDDGDMPR